MEYRENGTRFYNYYKWENKKNAPYDYEKYGLLKRLLSPTIINSNNEVLQASLKYVEKSLVFVMKYIDRLKHFKNYHWKNR